MKNAALFTVSCAVALVLAEFLARLALDPIDFLHVDYAPDPVLNHRIEAFAGGHDELGLRNKAGLRRAEILAIGDSMTYGMMATADESWPAHLQAITGRDVYNAGMGGYGPFRYLEMTRRILPRTNPAHVIVAVYIGNDYLDGYSTVYSREHWATYRAEGASGAVASTFRISQPAEGRLLGGLRDWLSKRSVIYRAVTQSAVFDGFRTSEAQASATDVVEVSLNGRATVLKPQETLRRVDLGDPRVEEGARLMEVALAETVDVIRKGGAAAHVAILPTKEAVYHPHVADQLSEAHRDTMTALAANEDRLNARLQAFLADIGVPFTDLRPVLSEAVKTAQVYPVTDGHPNGTGYAEIATALANAMGLKAR